jgi:hypothetical protein
MPIDCAARNMKRRFSCPIHSIPRGWPGAPAFESDGDTVPIFEHCF